MNSRLFVVKKPPFISSTKYANRVKRRYNFKSIGFSGTLDPFAIGTLIVATGKFTKLFQYLKKSPKRYRATLWFGAKSSSLDLENIEKIESVAEVDFNKIEEILTSLEGKITYLPPKYSAKKIDGKRAYSLARDKRDFKMKEITSTIHNIKILSYNHPFLTFEATVSEGTYIRSLGEIISNRLNIDGTLSYLERLEEGDFKFNQERFINPYNHLNLKKNNFLRDEKILELGKKLTKDDFETKESGIYLVETNNYYSIVEIRGDGSVKYKINNLPKEWC